MKNKEITTYLAAPWFKGNQKPVMDKVRNIILEYPEYWLLSPYYDGIVYNSETDSDKVANRAYNWNLDHAAHCDLIVAIVDDFDTGAMVEIGIKVGYRMAINADTDRAVHDETKILAYSDVPGRGLNLMLQKACSGFANGEKELREQLTNFKNGKPLYMPIFKKGEII